MSESVAGEIARKMPRSKCPYCARTVSHTKSGKVHAHLVKGTSRRCGGSGQQL